MVDMRSSCDGIEWTPAVLDRVQSQEHKHAHKNQDEDQMKPLPAPQACATTLPDPQSARAPAEPAAPALRTVEKEQNTRTIAGNCDTELADETSSSKVTTDHERQDMGEAKSAASSTKRRGLWSRFNRWSSRNMAAPQTVDKSQTGYHQANADNAGAIQRAEDEKMRREVEQWARRKIEQKALAAKAREEAQKHASAQTKENNGNVAAETTQSKGCTGIQREMNRLKDHQEKTHRETHDEAACEAEGARQQTEESVASECDYKARREVEEKVKHEIEEQVRREVQEKMKRELEGKIWREAEKKATAAAENRARNQMQEIEAKVRHQTERKLKREIEERVWREAERKAASVAEEWARCEAEERARRAVEERARQEAHEDALRDAEERAKFSAQLIDPATRQLQVAKEVLTGEEYKQLSGLLSRLPVPPQQQTQRSPQEDPNCRVEMCGGNSACYQSDDAHPLDVGKLAVDIARKGSANRKTRHMLRARRQEKQQQQQQRQEHARVQ